MPRSATQLDAGKRGLNMNFDHEELILSILVYTFFSRMFDLMLSPALKHSIAVA